MTNGPVAAEADALWRKQLGPLLTVTATASELGIPADDVEQMIEAKELLALPAEDGVLLPAFPFSDRKPLRALFEFGLRSGEPTGDGEVEKVRAAAPAVPADTPDQLRKPARRSRRGRASLGS
jgi:hypothetical protein